jgi:hypothetical protein
MCKEESVSTFARGGERIEVAADGMGGCLSNGQRYVKDVCYFYVHVDTYVWLMRAYR